MSSTLCQGGSASSKAIEIAEHLCVSRFWSFHSILLVTMSDKLQPVSVWWYRFYQTFSAHLKHMSSFTLDICHLSLLIMRLLD